MMPARAPHHYTPATADSRTTPAPGGRPRTLQRARLRAEWALGIATLLLLAVGLRPAGAEPPRPHILLILADDLGWRDVGYHGSEIETPHIDRIAREGVELDRFYVQPSCSPTRAALMTGKSPLRLGIDRPISKNERSRTAARGDDPSAVPGPRSATAR